MKLSIVTINKNNAEGLRRTLLSTLTGQPGFSDFEHIVVDGASEDGSVKVVELFRDSPQLARFVSEPDSGIYNAMNKGAAMASGEYLLFLNSGDALVEDVLARVFAVSLTADVVYGDLYAGKDSAAPIRTYPDPGEICPGYFAHSYLPHPASFISRAFFREIGGYDESFRIAGDTDFFVRAAVRGARFSHLCFPVSRYDLSGVSNSAKYRSTQEEERLRYLAPYVGVKTAELVDLALRFNRIVPSEMPMKLGADPDYRALFSVVPAYFDLAYRSRTGRFFLRWVKRSGKKLLSAAEKRERKAAQKAERETVWGIRKALVAEVLDRYRGEVPETIEDWVSRKRAEVDPVDLTYALMMPGSHVTANLVMRLPSFRKPVGDGTTRIVVVSKDLSKSNAADNAAAALSAWGSRGFDVCLVSAKVPTPDDRPVSALFRRVVLSDSTRKLERRLRGLADLFGDTNRVVLVHTGLFSKRFVEDYVVARLCGVPVVAMLENDIWDPISQNGTLSRNKVARLHMPDAVIALSPDHAESLRCLGISAVSLRDEPSSGTLPAFATQLFMGSDFGRKDPDGTPEGRMLSAMLLMQRAGHSESRRKLRELRFAPDVPLKGGRFHSTARNLFVRAAINSLAFSARTIRRFSVRLSRKRE